MPLQCPEPWQFEPITVTDHIRDDSRGAIVCRIPSMALLLFILVGLSTVGYIVLEFLGKIIGAQNVPVKILLELSENQAHLFSVVMSFVPKVCVR
jgi:hypothetical protein